MAKKATKGSDPIVSGLRADLNRAQAQLAAQERVINAAKGTGRARCVGLVSHQVGRGSILYRWDDDGQVYQWNFENGTWAALPMSEIVPWEPRPREERNGESHKADTARVPAASSRP